MFFAKKLLSVFFYPSSVGLLLLAAGLALLWFTGRARLGKLLATSGFGVLLLFSYNAVADLLLYPLEEQHPVLYPRAQLDAAIARAGATPRWIVVLAAGHVSDARLPPADRLGVAAMTRLVEGIRLHGQLPGSKLLLSGGLGTPEKYADVVGAVAEELGVRREDMVLHREGWYTEEEAATIAPLVGKQPFVLVTSASHMRRSMALFRKRGTNPIAAPTFHMAKDAPGVGLDAFFPWPGPLSESNAAAHEYMGMFWSKLRGRL
jgi:uncharacterized SAM-binding protein YcdF (DUF218 family)